LLGMSGCHEKLRYHHLRDHAKIVLLGTCSLASILSIVVKTTKRDREKRESPFERKY